MNKKQIFIPALAVLSLALWFGSCEPGLVVYSNNIQFDTIIVTKTHYLKNDSTQPSCNLRIQLVYPSGGGDSLSLKLFQQTFLSKFFGELYASLDIREAIAQYTADYIRNYEEDAGIFFSDRAKNHVEEGYPDQYFSYYETISDNITFDKAGLLAFRIHQTNFKADKTNSFQQFSNYVYSLKTGKLLTEETIFDEGYEKALNFIFKNKLLKTNAVETIDQLENIGYFGIEEIMPNNNFSIDEKGITYTFNKGEYSAMQLDEINIFLPYEEIAGILKENSPVSAFY